MATEGGSGRGSVAILGGGVAALTAAFELSAGNWTERFERITVYQRGWRLGGKGASGRGAHGRIEEHGLHVLLGYYDHTFDLMRRCYDELDRDRSDPACPIRTWADAVAPWNRVGVMDYHDGSWAPWVASFPVTAGSPGMPDPGSDPLSVPDVAIRSVRLLIEFFGSVAQDGRGRGSTYLSASPRPPRPADARIGPAAVLRGAALLGLALPLGWARRVLDVAGSSQPGQLDRALSSILEPLRLGLRSAFVSDSAARRTYDLLELVTANLVGIVSDRLLVRTEGFAAIDHLDYREWLAGHGIDPTALESPLLRAMYDLAFAYEGGDAGRPRFTAGLGLPLATRMLLCYSGGLFWKMQAGMGDVIFAPLYQVLKQRGVDFRFFHRVDSVRLDATGNRVDSVELGIQAEPDGGPGAYQPLVRVKHMPCWPNAPLAAQLRDPALIGGLDLESFWSPRRDAGTCTLLAGRDFDVVVFGLSLGMVPHVASDLVARSPAWQAMVDHLGLVATQSLQLWLHSDERSLGWKGAEGTVVSGFVKPFDTWASMSHLIPVEDWPDADQPRSIAYFCGATGPVHSTLDAERAGDEVRSRARRFLDENAARLWPAAADEKGFRWELLCDGDPPIDRGAGGADRLRNQYWRANVDPSDLYVQSLPDTDRYRLAPGDTGFDNLAIAGDWTDCGLNAGCVEAGTRSGQLAAQAVLDRNATRDEESHRP